MLAELVGWYAGHEQNRRRYQRVRKNYGARYSSDKGKTWLPLRGSDLGGGGLCATSDAPIDNVELDVVLQLDGAEIALKARPVWGSEVTEGAWTVHCYGFQFTRIDAASWEAVMRWVSGGEFRDHRELASVRIADTDVAHLLPLSLRNRVLHELSARGRLDASLYALPQFDYGGVTVMNGTPMHRFTVYSRVKVLGSEVRYTTRFLCDDRAEEIDVLE